MTRARYPWWLPVAATAGSVAIKLLAATWRYEVVDAPEYIAAKAAGEKVIYVMWHSGLLPLLIVRRDEGIAALVSQHRDGELITRVIAHLGYVTARGSSTRGGDAGMRELLAWAEAGHDLAITPDGPRGPAEKVKDGLLFLAARTRLRIVPMVLGARHAWRLRSWDRFRVPQPFSRVCVAHGAPFQLESGGGDGLERARLQVEHALHDLTRITQQRAGEVA